MCAKIIEPGFDGFHTTTGNILAPDTPLRSFQRQERAVGGRIDMGTHDMIHLSIIPQEGSNSSEQMADCLRQFKDMADKQGVSMSQAVQMTLFAPSEGYSDTEAVYNSQMEKLFGGRENTPAFSVIGQTPAFDRKAGFEAVLVAPKDDHPLRLNSVSGDPKLIGAPLVIGEKEISSLLGVSDGSLSGIGSAKYSVIEVDGGKWVYSAGLRGSMTDSTYDNARGALAKEIAILVKEGIFDPSQVVDDKWGRGVGALQTGLLNSRHYVHDIVGEAYNYLNVARDEAYDAARLYKPLPSATGIGNFSKPGDVVMELIGVSGVDYEPVVVAAHGEAWQYQMQWMSGQAVGSQTTGTGVGKKVSVPKFNRAVYLPGIGVMFISGTASVEKGKGLLYSPEQFDRESRVNNDNGVLMDVTEIADNMGVEALVKRGFPMVRGADDKFYYTAKTPALAQTIVTLRNITRLLAAREMSFNDMAISRVYIRDLEDKVDVMGLCGKIMGGVPKQCTQAPVCYDNWLVEIEGVAGKRKKLIY